MILTKTVEDSDYQLIESEVEMLKDSYKFLTDRKVKIDIGHEHRYWEYGMAMKAMHTWESNNGKTNVVIDIGAGDGLLGPTLSYKEDKFVVELEPNLSCIPTRDKCNEFLLFKMTKLTHSIEQEIKLENEYPIVFCISVIEHVVDDHAFLRKLSELVAPDGLLFITTDVMPIMPGKYHFDNLRERNYTMFDICKKIEYLHSIGFSSLGDVDLEYKGDKVFNYSFASIAMVKTS